MNRSKIETCPFYASGKEVVIYSRKGCPLKRASQNDDRSPLERHLPDLHEAIVKRREKLSLEEQGTEDDQRRLTLTEIIDRRRAAQHA